MIEHRFTGQDYVSSFGFHEHRALGDHLHDIHRVRLDASADAVRRLAAQLDIKSWIDYGCGQGGLLALVGDVIPVKAGYDFMPSNLADAVENERTYVHNANFIEFDHLDYADLVTMTEVLEHLDDPHGFLKRIPCDWIFATVPAGETPEHHDEAHLWAWDEEGFRRMFIEAGFKIVESGPFVIPPPYPMAAQFVIAMPEEDT